MNKILFKPSIHILNGLCVHTVEWLHMPGIFIVRSDVNACDCTRDLYERRTETESALEVLFIDFI